MREFGRLTALLLKVRFLARARRTRLALAQEVFLRVRADLQRRSAAAHEERNHLSAAGSERVALPELLEPLQKLLVLLRRPEHRLLVLAERLLPLVDILLACTLHIFRCLTLVAGVLLAGTRRRNDRWHAPSGRVAFGHPERVCFRRRLRP